jgi:hypothetical protein
MDDEVPDDDVVVAVVDAFVVVVDVVLALLFVDELAGADVRLLSILFNRN